MVVFNLKTLIQKKSFSDKQKCSYKDIEKSTGIKSYRLSRINTTTDYNIDIKDLEKLCNYFNCTPNDLITIYPDEKPE
jgi:putative transcriptional regulator